jgi:hypothetical protein
MDGSYSTIRSNWPVLKRVSFDKRPPVIETRKITVETLILYDQETGDVVHIPGSEDELPENWVDTQKFTAHKMQGTNWASILAQEAALFKKD